MKITLVVGTRPNFIKVAPLIRAIEDAAKKDDIITYRLIHTGQHWDATMNDIFFDELLITKPHNHMKIGNNAPASQFAEIMRAFMRELEINRPDIVVVFGDCTTTIACAMATKMMNIKLAHVEAGIRSFDLTMPEELNRLNTDRISDYFFTTSEFANENLRKEGFFEENIFFVGNVMVDTLLQNISRFKAPKIYSTLGLNAGGYLLLTLHRPANVDNPAKLKEIIAEISKYSNGLPIIFPIHPRTRKTFLMLDLNYANIHITEPMSYLEFNYVVKNAVGVLTDSGGVQEETTVLGVPCLTIRSNTERPETCHIGTNELVDIGSVGCLQIALEKLTSGRWKNGRIPDLWDGKSAERIVRILLTIIKTR